MHSNTGACRSFKTLYPLIIEEQHQAIMKPKVLGYRPERCCTMLIVMCLLSIASKLTNEEDTINYMYSRSTIRCLANFWGYLYGIVRSTKHLPMPERTYFVSSLYCQMFISSSYILFLSMCCRLFSLFIHLDLLGILQDIRHDAALKIVSPAGRNA